MKKFQFLLIVMINIAYAETVLITAATGAFGEFISFQLACENFNLVLAGRNKSKLDNLKKRILTKYKTVKISTLLIDFANIDSIQSSIKKTSFPQSLDGVVLIGPRPALPQKNIPTPQEWQNAFNETFIAPLEFLKQIIPFLNNGSSIVIISGSTSKEYSKAYPNTNLVRLMWIGEVKNLMHLLTLQKIRVNAISPGPIFTEFHRQKITKTAQANNLTFEEQMKENCESIPAGSYGSLDDIAELVHFLITKKSKHINGTNILLDGGSSNAY